MIDTEEKNFRKAIYTIVRDKIPELRALRYCDRKTPAMEKIFHLSHCTTLSIERSCDFLNDADPFGTYNGTSDLLEFKETKMFGTTVDSTNS